MGKEFAQKKVLFTETVLRDANQSLIATRLPYSKFADILPTMDKAGYYSVECWGGAVFDVCLRYLDEDPWQRLRNLRKAMPNTKLQMLLRGQNLLGYKHYPDEIVKMFVEKSVDNGIDIIRIFDALNDVRNLETATKTAIKCGATVSGAIAKPRPHSRSVCKACKTTRRNGRCNRLREGYGRHDDSVRGIRAYRRNQKRGQNPRRFAHALHHGYGVYDVYEGNRSRR